MRIRSDVVSRLVLVVVLTTALGSAFTACGGRLESTLDEPTLNDGPCPGRGCGAVGEQGAPDGAGRGDTGLDVPVDAGRDAFSSSDGPSDAGACANGPGARFVTSVVDHAFGTGQNYNQSTGFPSAIYGPPYAGNPSSVVSLGNGGWVIVAFDGNAIVDGKGIDFTVFENPLANFKELATVAVSEDGVDWQEFPCTAPQKSSDYGFCAGVKPVLSTPTNGIDPLDPNVSGGDGYDLAAIGVARARYVRITDRVDLDGNDGVFDLDAVAIVNAECP